MAEKKIDAIEPPPKKGDLTRAAILASAARRFAEKGYADCSLREIAALTDMKAGSVYYHFASKEVLLDAVLQAGIDRLTNTVQQHIDELGGNVSAATQLRAMIRAHVTSFLDVRDNANTYLRIYEYLPPVMKRRTRSSRRNYAQIWFDVFDRGVSGGEFSATVDRIAFVSFLLQSMNGVIEWFRPSRMTIDGVCEVIETAVLDGILIDQDGKRSRRRAGRAGR